jgi:hypothetical protein
MFCAILLVILSTLISNSKAADNGEKITLFGNGIPTCVIVAADGLSVSEKKAISELQKHLQAITESGPIEVIPPDKARSFPGPKIVVGHKTVRHLHPEISLNDLGTDGFILKTVGQSVLVAGGEKRGTLYAAYELLERLGCRWWTVTATHIPRNNTLIAPPLDLRQIPKLEYRDMLYGDRPYISNDENSSYFFTRNKVNGFNYATNPEELGGRVHFEENLVHSYARLMRPIGGMDGSFAKHPEYWALVGGNRNPGQPCTTHPMVFEIMKANVLKQLKEHPEYEFIVVGQEDNNHYCQCETCNALITAEESPAGPGIALANKIAEVVEKEFPGKWIMAPAYTWSRKPPKNLRPRANVGITLCSIECDFNRPLTENSTPANQAFAADIAQWGKIAPKLYIWDYTTNFTHYLLPFPNLDALVPNIQYLAQHGAKGILEQGSHSTAGAEFAALRMWVLARALWNPDADGKTLIREFLDGYYGPAGASIQKYIDILHAPGRADPTMPATCYSKMDSAWLTPEVIAQSSMALHEAERAVDHDPTLLARVRHAHAPIRYVLLKRGTQSKAWLATTAQLRKLDAVDVAKQLEQSIIDSKMIQIAEGEPVKPFIEWAHDYAARAAQSAPVPPELKGADPQSYRLIQACQMDQRPRWWMRHPEASDGWVSEIPTVAWLTNVRLSTIEDVTPGKTYKIYVRIKTTKSQQDGIAVACGIYNKEAKIFLTKKIPAVELADEKFHAIEVGQFVASESNNLFWMALQNAAAPPVLLDCLWVKEQ